MLIAEKIFFYQESLNSDTKNSVKRKLLRPLQYPNGSMFMGLQNPAENIWPAKYLARSRQ